MDLRAEVSKIWPPPVRCPVSPWGAGRRSVLFFWGHAYLPRRLAFRQGAECSRATSGPHTPVPAAACFSVFWEIPQPHRSAGKHELLAIWAAWKHQRILLLDTAGAEFTSLCFSKHLTHQKELVSPRQSFFLPCLQPQRLQACHRRTWRRGR